MAVSPVASADPHRQFIEANAPTPVVSDKYDSINIGRLLTLFKGLNLDKEELIHNFEGANCTSNNLRTTLDVIDSNIQCNPQYAALKPSIQLLIHLLDLPENLDMHRVIFLPIAFGCNYNLDRVTAEINQVIMILQTNDAGPEELPPPPPDADLV